MRHSDTFFLGTPSGFVDLVDGDNDGDFCSFRMCNGFARLWHDPIISSDHKNCDISYLCTC